MCALADTLTQCSRIGGHHSECCQHTPELLQLRSARQRIPLRGINSLNLGTSIAFRMAYTVANKTGGQPTLCTSGWALRAQRLTCRAHTHDPSRQTICIIFDYSKVGRNNMPHRANSNGVPKAGCATSRIDKHRVCLRVPLSNPRIMYLPQIAICGKYRTLCHLGCSLSDGAADAVDTMRRCARHTRSTPHTHGVSYGRTQGKRENSPFLIRMLNAPRSSGRQKHII